MKPLLFLKWVDLAVQLLALIVTPNVVTEKGALLIGWVALGAAQTLSCAVNLFVLKKQHRAKTRRGYEVISALFVAACIPFLLFTHEYNFEPIMEAIKGLLCVIVFSSPVLAIWYVTMTIAEMFKINNNEDAIHPEAN